MHFSLPGTLPIPAGVAPGAARRLIRRLPAGRKACHVVLLCMKCVHSKCAMKVHSCTCSSGFPKQLIMLRPAASQLLLPNWVAWIKIKTVEQEHEVQCLDIDIARL